MEKTFRSKVQSYYEAIFGNRVTATITCNFKLSGKQERYAFQRASIETMGRKRGGGDFANNQRNVLYSFASRLLPSQVITGAGGWVRRLENLTWKKKIGKKISIGSDYLRESCCSRSLITSLGPTRLRVDKFIKMHI